MKMECEAYSRLTIDDLDEANVALNSAYSLACMGSRANAEDIPKEVMQDYYSLLKTIIYEAKLKINNCEQ